jgi:hypothetical protein
MKTTYIHIQDGRYADVIWTRDLPNMKQVY